MKARQLKSWQIKEQYGTLQYSTVQYSYSTQRFVFNGVPWFWLCSCGHQAIMSDRTTCDFCLAHLKSITTTVRHQTLWKQWQTLFNEVYVHWRAACSRQGRSSLLFNFIIASNQPLNVGSVSHFWSLSTSSLGSVKTLHLPSIFDTDQPLLATVSFSCFYSFLYNLSFWSLYLFSHLYWSSSVSFECF